MQCTLCGEDDDGMGYEISDYGVICGECADSLDDERLRFESGEDADEAVDATGSELGADADDGRPGHD